MQQGNSDRAHAPASCTAMPAALPLPAYAPAAARAGPHLLAGGQHMEAGRGRPLQRLPLLLRHLRRAVPSALRATALVSVGCHVKSQAALAGTGCGVIPCEQCAASGTVATRVRPSAPPSSRVALCFPGSVRRVCWRPAKRPDCLRPCCNERLSSYPACCGARAGAAAAPQAFRSPGSLAGCMLVRVTADVGCPAAAWRCGPALLRGHGTLPRVQRRRPHPLPHVRRLGGPHATARPQARPCGAARRLLQA